MKRLDEQKDTPSGYIDTRKEADYIAHELNSNDNVDGWYYKVTAIRILEKGKIPVDSYTIEIYDETNTRLGYL